MLIFFLNIRNKILSKGLSIFKNAETLGLV